MNQETELEELELEACCLQHEIFDGHLNFGEVPIKMFVRWYNYRMNYEPELHGSRLDTFDFGSARMLFEEFVKATLKKYSLL